MFYWKCLRAFFKFKFQAFGIKNTSTFSYFKLKRCEILICVFQFKCVSFYFKGVKQLPVLSKQAVWWDYLNECYCLSVFPGYFQYLYFWSPVWLKVTEGETGLYLSLHVSTVPHFWSPWTFPLWFCSLGSRRKN